ncbi:tyrosine-type recombinase/integrase [Kribbella sp. NPDC004536]|uniref:tyrosine-type recombinase/integrase n=1 Tax=Kribbella sp. NPDC004536 TaxID=3364106 RepID=UPI003678A6EB
MIPKAKLRDRLPVRVPQGLGRPGERGPRRVPRGPGPDAREEHVLVHGKGGRIRIVLLDDQKLVNLLRRFLRETGWTHGPLFRATRNWTGRPLTYSTVQEMWARYRDLAGEPDLELHQLRHTHATQLNKDGVSARTIQKRLGHRKLQPTIVYVDHSDELADAELRARQ